MAEIDDGKVILKKVIIADTEEQDKAPQKEEAGPVLSDDIKMLVTSMIHKDGKAFARVSCTSCLYCSPTSHKGTGRTSRR